LKRLLVVLGVMMAFLVAGTALAENKGPAKIDLKGATKKAVEFDHAKHQGMAGVTCKECHHKDEAGKEVGCEKCHAAADAKVKMQDAMHKNCKGCHETRKSASPNAPTMCPKCHTK
jgi:hypothetical protein